MKKMMAVILCLAMLLCAAAVTAESAGKVTLGTISINGVFSLQCGLPEGYSVTPVEVGMDHVYATMKSEDPNAPVMQLSVYFDELYSEVDRLNDLTEEELKDLEYTFIEDDPLVEITYGETGYGTLLLIARHDTEDMDYVAFFSIYKGYNVEFVLVPSFQAEDRNLTEEQMMISIDFLTDLDFIPSTVPTVNAKTFAGQEVIANLSDYDPETNTVQAEVKQSITLDPEYVDTLHEGGGILLGAETTIIKTLEQDEEGLTINGEIYLMYAGDEVRVFLYDEEYMQTLATLRVGIPETLVFLDYIDPENGEALDEPTEHTGAELAAMLADESAGSFAVNNVYVTFDEDGEVSKVERHYSSRQ